MLQPRVVCVKMELLRMCWSFFVCAAFLSVVLCQDINNEELIESSRIKRENVPENRDLTVLLVNQKNDYNTRIGRYHSVKPLIGLLTSTARTFIQDGVTTEFATQILGTTLDNGRIYAQLLTKSSLVLYNKPSNVEDAIVVQPTRIHSAFDGEWNVKQDLGYIDPEKFVLKNTDYLAPNSKVETVYASKPSQENIKAWNSPQQTEEKQFFDEPVGRRVQPFKEIPRYVQNEAINYLDGPTIENEKKLEYIIEPSLLQNVNILHRQNKAYEPVTEPIKDAEQELPNESSVVKVKPNYDLPTFTIKNEFSPIFYYIDNVESKRPQPLVQQTKVPKKLFGQKSEPRPKKTFTYEGFADFTTVVGDTVIIFTPNTELSRQPNRDEVNVFPSAQRVDNLATKITFLTGDIPVGTSTYKAHEVSTATRVTSSSSSSEDNRSEKALFNDEVSLKKVLYEVDDKIPDSISVQYNSGFDLNVDVIQPSEAAVTTTESTRVTDDLGVLPIQNYNSEATEPLVYLSPSSTVIDVPTESAVTEQEIVDLFTRSEEEYENTAAEVTERTEEEEEEDEETTSEVPEILTTTESGHSEESSEDFETTTESKPYVTEIDDDDDEQDEVVCTHGLETQSTMTTAYKTLTYLTTYFIPLESTETTTSIRSDVVVESNVGYFTNVVCRTDVVIEPTAVFGTEVNPTLKVPDTVSEEITTKRPTIEPSTESTYVTEQEYQETVKPEQETSENKEQEQTKEETVATTTTTEKITTENRVEVTTAESITTTTEKSPSEELKDEDTENEIDVIYKTLYTTYTYFTTFFGDSTSSVASHKSVVTNILTTTIDLSKLDPSLLGAFNEDEIAPTNVGIGRPTATYVNSIIDLVKNKDVIESVEVDETYSSQTPTPSLGDDVASINPDSVKTYFTTYTFFTTIYVGDDANVCSRNEVYTNYVGPEELIPTKANPLGNENTKAQFDFRNCKQVKREPLTNPDEEESTSMVTSVSMEHSSEKAIKVVNQAKPQPTPIEVDMLFSVESNPLESENSYVTDVKSSSSKGDRQYLENNNVLDDQISSESNIDEIMPSPTLLLQTSYTTFTYFTTMYIGKDSSKVKSHLETITNVVTETIMPNKETEDESNLPITYYTTFTYWTTLYKDKSTTITSREEIVSNIVTPSPQAVPTISPIDTTPIDIDSVLPPKDLEVEIKPSLIDDNSEQDDGKATFYTTYTYFTTFYAGNTSQIRSSLETVTNVVDNTKIVDDNQIARKVPSGSLDKNLIQDNGGKPIYITPTVVKEEIQATKQPDISAASPTVLLGTYIDNLFAEVKPAEPSSSEPEKKILFSQVAVISGDSTIVTSDNKTLQTTTSSTTTTEGSIISPTPEVIESSVTDNDSTTESRFEDDEDSAGKKKSRLTFTPRRPSVTPVIIPFSSRNRPTFVPKRVPVLSSATTITRQEATPTITATPTLKSVRQSAYSGGRKQSSAFPGSSSAGKRFSGRSSISNPSANIPSASRSGNFGRSSIQPTSRRTGFRSSSLRSNSLDYASRSAVPRIRPTASSRLPIGRGRSSTIYQNQDDFAETLATQQEENATESLDEVTEAPVRTTNNPLFRFRRPPVARQPGTAITPRSTTPTARRAVTPRARVTTTTRKITTRSTTNPLLSLRRQRPNALFPKRNLFRQPEPEPEEVNEQIEENDEILEEEEFEEDNDYDSSDRKERQIAATSTAAPKRSNIVQIRPFGFRRRSKRQIDYGNRKYSNFRRPGLKPGTTRKPEPEVETEPPATPKQRPGPTRFSPRNLANSRSTTAASPRSSPRQSFIVRGESRTTTATPAYRRAKPGNRASSRASTTLASRPKAPRLSGARATSRASTTRSRARTTTSRASSRQRGSFENHSGERYNSHNNILNDGKITITHQIPTEVTIPFFNGKFTEYKNVLSATPKVETLLLNQVSTSLGPLGNAQLVLAAESTELADNGATKEMCIKYFSVLDLQCGNSFKTFNTNAIVYDNTPWQPGRDIDVDRLPEDERKLKNLATRIMSNGVEVLVKDKNGEIKPEQRKLKVMQITSMKPPTALSTQTKSLLSSAVATVINHQQISALFPLHQLMQHNYIIKTCMTTYTYLTTVVQNKRSAISTFETIVSVVTTESLTNYQDLLADLKPTKTKYMEVKTIQPSVAPIMYGSNFAKIDKRIDSSEDNNYDLIQPSEVSHMPCTSTSCPCSHTKTESLKTKYTNIDASAVKYGVKASKYVTKLDLKPTNKDDKNTKYPYEFETTSQLAPIDKIVEKYTEVMNDYSDEKDSNTVEESELLTNEQAPNPTKVNKVNKVQEKKPEKPPKTNKNKFVVADLLKLGTLGIKGLTQLAPVIEKMTGSFIKRHDAVSEKTTTTTIKPVEKVVAYNANKRLDSEIESKHSSFPIYIPVDEMETSESQMVFTNATLHQNLAWAAEHKHPKLNIVPHKIIHESPLVNGGIPISPGEIITANSDVIVGKPAVGGPLTLAASGIKLHNPVNPPPLDSFVAANEEYHVKERPMSDQPHLDIKVDDSFDLRPPELPRPKPNRPLPKPRPIMNIDNFSKYPYRMPNAPNDDEPKIIPVKPTNPIMVNHGRPAFLDYIPSLASVTEKYAPIKHHVDFKPAKENIEEEIPDNSPSSSEIVNSHIRTEEKYTITSDSESNKPFLVDIQPSRVANVLIPHGSSTAIVFAGSSEPHKTGDYIDDPLPYPEPGYFGSFSIDAPQMTNVHNVAPNNKPFLNKQTLQSNMESYKPSTPLESYKSSTTQHKDHLYRNDLKLKWKDNRRPIDINKLPPPMSNQETHVQVGPQITAYNPDIYNPSNADFNKYSNFNKGNDKHKKEVIDKEYENYLAVPPPPPKMIFNDENKNKPHNQRPIVHTKPIQDMKVFLNIQHPIPDQLPPKVTSEIYFAAQAPYSKQTPTYTIHIPPATQPSFSFNKQQVNNISPPKLYSASNNIHNSFTIDSHNVANKSIVAHDHDKENTYTVTLNTATNVANNVNDVGQVFGSSVPVALETNASNGALNADIPIGTNFAIRVEDNTPSETYNLQQGNRNPIAYDEHGRVPNGIAIGDNRWNKSSTDVDQNTIIGHNYPQNYNEKPVPVNIYRPTTTTSTYTVRPSITSSLNSHANFPVMHEHPTYFDSQTTPNEDKRPTFDKFNTDVTTNDPKRPGKLIPNIPTNSHGWYSSVLVDHNNVKNIDIKTESSTRKVIPLIHDIEGKGRLPTFGQKIASAGKPPTEFWAQTKPTNTNNDINLNLGKPFTKSQPIENQNINSVTNKPIDQNNYVISNFGSIKQPAYDIPIRDNSDETTTLKSSTEKVKPVYETSEEIYDGEEETVEVDGEVSSESMKIPVVSSSVEKETPEKDSTAFTLLQDEILDSIESTKKPISTTTQSKPNLNLGTQTEKPFGSFNKTNFQSNSMKPIYDSNPFSKPRPFTAGVLDHQLQQPHWQINNMMENSTNVSYEENLDLNIGEEMSSPSTAKLPTTNKPHHSFGKETEVKYKNQRPVTSHLNNTHVNNDSGIITSTVHIKDKKPLIVEKLPTKTTLPTFTLPNELDLNKTSSEIIDLSPPPPTVDYSFKPSSNDEMIMGMSPPPPRNPPGLRQPPRVHQTPRPAIPARTPPTHGIKPPRTIPPRLSPPRPTRKPVRDEVATYRPPAYDTLNSIRRPTYNRDQPSSQLLPPPRGIPSRGSQFVESPSTTVSAPNIVFPTPISSGWLTSSGIEFSSSFNFAPTSIQFPETTKPSTITENYDTLSSENVYSYENDYPIEQNNDNKPVKPNTEDRISDSKEASTQGTTKLTSTEINDSHADESSHEQSTTGKIKVVPLNKNRTRKPYPFRHDDRKPLTSKFKPPINPTQIIRPTKTLTRPDILYPTRHTTIKKIVRPILSRPAPITPLSVIESSESTVDDDFIRPTEVLRDSVIPTMSYNADYTNKIHEASMITPTLEDSISLLQATHHAGNEIKISDEVIPTKTEFKTTVVTLTKTLSEPPLTISSVGYVNLTHTLTVTHTKTSLVSQSEGAITQTLILTNTHTSTIVDVVTEIHTKVQPTTIIETVTKHIPIPQVQPTSVQGTLPKTKKPLDDITMSSEEENLIIRDNEMTENVQKIDTEEGDNDTFFVVMNKSQNGGQVPPVNTEIETGDFDVTRNEQVNSNGVSQVLFGEILLAGTPYLETNVHPNGYGKECQPDCKASRNERCQRIDGLMKCVCRPGFARMFPDRPCKPTYTYSVKLALGSQGNERLQFQESLSDNSSKQYQALAAATHEGINRMVMQSDLRDVFHGIHINGFKPVEIKDGKGDQYKGVMNDFYVQLSDNAHESRLKEVIEKYLRTNNYSLGGTNVHAASELMNKLDVSDFDECKSAQFHDCSEHAQCFNLRGTYTCSCLEGYADLSVNTLYPGRICSAEPVGCERCNYHGSCYSRDDQRVLCECFQWYAGSSCQVNLKVVLISLVVLGALLTVVLAICAVVACSKKKPRPPKRSIVACIQSMPSLHQGAMPSKQRADRRALINEREGGDNSSVQNASLPYMPAKRISTSKKCIISDPPAHDPPPPPAPAVMIPRARLHAHHDSRENISRKRSLEMSNEAKLISYLESGAISGNDEMRRKHSLESSYSANKERHNKQGALVSAGFKVSTTVRPDESNMNNDRDDLSSVNKNDLEAELRFDSLRRKSYSQDDMSEWTEAERRMGELTLSEARSVGGTLPASTGRAASSTRLTHQEANTMAERDLGSTFLLPHVHLYKPDLTSDVSEFDSL